MKLIHKAMAGTMESSDIMVTIEPKEEGGIELELTSSVMQQFGRQIEEHVEYVRRVLQRGSHPRDTEGPGRGERPRDRGRQGRPGLHHQGQSQLRSVPRCGQRRVRMGGEIK